MRRSPVMRSSLGRSSASRFRGCRGGRVDAVDFGRRRWCEDRFDDRRGRVVGRGCGDEFGGRIDICRRVAGCAGERDRGRDGADRDERSERRPVRAHQVPSVVVVTDIVTSCFGPVTPRREGHDDILTRSWTPRDHPAMSERGRRRHRSLIALEGRGVAVSEAAAGATVRSSRWEVRGRDDEGGAGATVGSSRWVRARGRCGIEMCRDHEQWASCSSRPHRCRWIGSRRDERRADGGRWAHLHHERIVMETTIIQNETSDRRRKVTKFAVAGVAVLGVGAALTSRPHGPTTSGSAAAPTLPTSNCRVGPAAAGRTPTPRPRVFGFRRLRSTKLRGHRRQLRVPGPQRWRHPDLPQRRPDRYRYRWPHRHRDRSGRERRGDPR